MYFKEPVLCIRQQELVLTSVSIIIIAQVIIETDAHALIGQELCHISL